MSVIFENARTACDILLENADLRIIQENFDFCDVRYHLPLILVRLRLMLSSSSDVEYFVRERMAESSSK